MFLCVLLTAIGLWSDSLGDFDVKLGVVESSLLILLAEGATICPVCSAKNNFF